jgi:hypothetical protein
MIAKFFAKMRTPPSVNQHMTKYDPTWWVNDFNLQQSGIMLNTDDHTRFLALRKMFKNRSTAAQDAGLPSSRKRGSSSAVKDKGRTSASPAPTASKKKERSTPGKKGTRKEPAETIRDTKICFRSFLSHYRIKGQNGSIPPECTLGVDCHRLHYDKVTAGNQKFIYSLCKKEGNLSELCKALVKDHPGMVR